MALGPNALRDPTPQDKTQADAIEVQIDKQIQLTNSDSNAVHVNFYGEIHTRVRRILTDRYIKAGWRSVEFKCNDNYDPREPMSSGSSTTVILAH